MVIINHTHGFILDYKSDINIIFYCILFSLCKIGVPIFLMITGTLILDKEYNYKKVFKCIYRVLIPVVGLSFILYINNVGINGINIISFVKQILSEPYIFHFWYVYALIGIYLVIPFVQKMIKKFSDKDYIIFISLFLLLPTILNTISSVFRLQFSSNISMPFFPIIIALLICGNYISKIKKTRKYLIYFTTLFIISYICMFLSMYIPYLNNGIISYKFDSWDSMPVLLMSISIFYIIKYYFENIKYTKISYLIQEISSTTFGIYLIHTIINWELYNISIIKSIYNINGILGSILLEILVFIICCFIIYLLKKIPIIKKFL